MKRKEGENMQKNNTLISPFAKKKIGVAIRTVLAVVVTIIMVFPLYWLLATSLKTEEEVMSATITFWPKVL